MISKPIAIVDVDNTLYDFSIPLYQELTKKFPGYPPPGFWSDWDFHKFCGIPDKDFYQAVNTIHTRQLEFDPYPGAKVLLDTLYENYEVVIATVRQKNKEQFEVLYKWLIKNDLPYDDLTISQDKIHLIDTFKPVVVFDDCPKTMLHCLDRGIEVWAIKFPWNENIVTGLSGSMRELAYTFKAQHGFCKYKKYNLRRERYDHERTSI